VFNVSVFHYVTSAVELVNINLTWNNTAERTSQVYFYEKRLFTR